MQIDESDEQFQNDESPINESCEPDSNVTVERDRQLKNVFLQSVRRDEGIQIDESDEHS
jgi:hypothetical protein